jgi:hypothetical protein
MKVNHLFKDWCKLGLTTLREKRKPAGNKGFAIAGVPCFADALVVNQTLVLRINICGENRHLRQARNRYASLFLDRLVQ